MTRLLLGDVRKRSISVMARNGVTPPLSLHFPRTVITRRIISWCADGGGGRFHGEGTRVVLVLLCSFHSNYPEPFQAFWQNSGGGPFG